MIRDRLWQLARAELNALLEAAERRSKSWGSSSNDIPSNIHDAFDHWAARMSQGIGQESGQASGQDSGQKEGQDVEDGSSGAAAGRSGGTDQARSGADAKTKGSGIDLSQLSDADLAAEIERRRLVREFKDFKAHGGNPFARARRAGAAGRAKAGPGAASKADVPRFSRDVIQAFQTLELGPTRDLGTVKSRFRKLMRQHHPDQFARDPKAQAKATQRAAEISAAFETIERALSSPA